MNKTVLVIGGGPGGYVAAIRAAQLGAEVTLIEKEKVGGTCLNVGCIPTKTLLQSAHLYEQIQNAEQFGIHAEAAVDWNAVQTRREAVTAQLRKGVEGLLQANGVKVVEGTATFVDEKTVCVHSENRANETLRADNIILATGSIPACPPILGIHSDFCIDSTAALSLDHVPQSMVIVGGGVIGIELACAYHAFGTQITILEMAERILPNMDAEISVNLRRDLEKRGIKIETKIKVTGFTSDDGTSVCCAERDGVQTKFAAEKMLIAIGRRADFSALAPEKAGIKAERWISVDEHLRTNVPHIYAIGDCNGKTLLAHAASEQGMIAAENCMGANRAFGGNACPSGIYSDPEIASAGLTEEQAKEQGRKYRTGTFTVMANGRALTQGQQTGFVKILVAEECDEILGVHIYAPQATELIAQAVLAMRLEATLEELVDTIFAHPTLSECLHEAALAADGRAIHIPNRPPKSGRR